MRGGIDMDQRIVKGPGMKWVPCKHRLPAIGRWVLAWEWVDTGDAIVAKRSRRRWESSSGASYYMSWVTHWMPLPRKPRA